MPALSHPGMPVLISNTKDQYQAIIQSPVPTNRILWRPLIHVYTHVLINSYSLTLTKIPCASLLEIPLTLGCVDVSLAVLLLTWPTKENLSSTCSLGEIGFNMQYYLFLSSFYSVPYNSNLCPILKLSHILSYHKYNKTLNSGDMVKVSKLTEFRNKANKQIKEKTFLTGMNWNTVILKKNT